MYQYQSALAKDIRYRIWADETIRRRLAKALKKLMLSNSHISIVDSISLGKLIERCYNLPGNYFAAVPYSDLKNLGEEILSGW